MVERKTDETGLPDLQLVLRDRLEPAGLAFEFQLSSPHPGLGLDFDSFSKRDLPKEEIFEKRIQDLAYISQPELQDVDPQERAELASDFGLWLFKGWFPEELKAKLESIAPRVESLRVLEENPWIPWELIVTPSKEEKGPAWGHRYAISRWLTGSTSKKPRSIERIAVVGAASEGAFVDLETLAGSKAVTMIPFKLNRIREALEARVYDLIHFQGLVQVSKDQPGLTLEVPSAGSEPWLLHPHNLPPMGEAHDGVGPVVTFGGTATECLSPDLSRTHGWAKAFLEAGASAFLGCYWQTKPKITQKIFEAFFENLFLGMPLGFAAREARCACRWWDPIDSLAFTLYAHPLAFCGSGPYLPRKKSKPETRVRQLEEPIMVAESRTRNRFENLKSKKNVKIGPVKNKPKSGHSIETEFIGVEADGDIHIDKIENR